MEITRPTKMIIDLNAFNYNVEQIKNIVGKDVKLMPAVKANGYGTYINKINFILNQFDILALAIVDEGVDLRKQGYEKEIFILNQPDKEEIEKIIKYNITIGVSDYSFIEELGKKEEKIKVHIEVDTGMGRTGINPKNIVEFIEKIEQYSNIEIEGIYTHLSSADIDVEYTKEQLEKFENSVSKAKEFLGEIKYIHCSASNGILHFPYSYNNLVRPGIILYGYEAGDNTFEKINLKPVAKLKSKVTFLKEVDKNTSISYSRKFITDKKSKIATIPVGYADGIPRALSNKGYVVINNKKAPIIGSICMDSFMVDVTDIENVMVGTDVYLWDNDIITLESIANLVGTINYEILSTISYRVPREFI